jgi:beta-N-acetylhexosaminidase
VGGRALTRKEAATLRRVRPAGIVLVTRNIGDEAELRSLVAELRAIVPEGIFGLDGEGGRVDRLKRIVGPSPAASELALQPSSASRRAGRRIGKALREHGFDLDFAPVVDLDHGRVGNALDQRTFGRTPRAVVTRARAFAEGLAREGVGSCIKHFPGLGEAPADTHESFARIDLARAQLERELTPFTALFASTQSVMVSHAIYRGWDESERPATLSQAICEDLLRRKLRYRGALLSDDLEMGALREEGTLPEIAAQSLAAGCDGLLFCRRIDAAPEIAAALGRRSLRPRLEVAARRLERLRAELAKMKRAAAT